MSIPTDLVPLPTMPWSTRPPEIPLSVEECRTALWRNNGNVTKAADMLKVPSDRLRRFITSSPFLSAQANEAREQLLDIAEDNLREALEDDSDTVRRDNMTKFALKELGGARGYGSGSKGVTIKPGQGSGRFVFEWNDGSSFSADDPGGPMIDHDDDGRTSMNPKVVNG